MLFIVNEKNYCKVIKLSVNRLKLSKNNPIYSFLLFYLCHCYFIREKDCKKVIRVLIL